MRSLERMDHGAFDIDGGFNVRFFPDFSLDVKTRSFKLYFSIKTAHHAPDPRSTPLNPCQPKLIKIVTIAEMQGNRKLKGSQPHVLALEGWRDMSHDPIVQKARSPGTAAIGRQARNAREWEA